MRLYIAPDTFWELPAGASADSIRADVRAAMTAGDVVEVTVLIGSVSAPLVLNGKVLAQVAVTGSDQETTTGRGLRRRRRPLGRIHPS